MNDDDETPDADPEPPEHLSAAKGMGSVIHIGPFGCMIPTGIGLPPAGITHSSWSLPGFAGMPAAAATMRLRRIGSQVATSLAAVCLEAPVGCAPVMSFK